MNKIVDEDIDVFYEATEEEEKELEYVNALTTSCRNVDEYEMWQHFSCRFWNRVCHKNMIKEPFTKEQFLNEKDIIATLEAFELNVNKFWWVVLFIYDWTSTEFTKCVHTENPSKSVRDILDYINGSHDIEIIFKIKGKKCREANDNVKMAVIEGLKQKSEEWENEEFGYIFTSNCFNATFNIMSYNICFATDKFKLLFEVLNLQKKATSKMDVQKSAISYNKMLLISRLIYFMRMTGNESFKDSDDSLKGVLKSYANKLPCTISSVYGF